MRTSSPRRSSPLLLVRPHELGLLEHVALHRLEELRLRRVAEVAEDRVERVQLEEVAVAADRRAWAAVADALPVVRALARALRQVLRARALGQIRGAGRHVGA